MSENVWDELNQDAEYLSDEAPESDDWKGVRVAVATMRVAVERGRALERVATYAKHEDNCDIRWPGGICTCGLREAFDALNEQAPDTEARSADV